MLCVDRLCSVLLCSEELFVILVNVEVRFATKGLVRCGACRILSLSILHSLVQYCAAQYCAVLCSAVCTVENRRSFSTALCSAVPRCIVLCRKEGVNE